MRENFEFFDWNDWKILEKSIGYWISNLKVLILFPILLLKMYWISNTNTFSKYWIPNTYSILIPCIHTLMQRISTTYRVCNFYVRNIDRQLFKNSWKFNNFISEEPLKWHLQVRIWWATHCIFDYSFYDVIRYIEDLPSHPNLVQNKLDRVDGLCHQKI